MSRLRRLVVAPCSRALREALVWTHVAWDRVVRRHSPRVVFFQGDNIAGRLRAKELVDALRSRGRAAICVPLQLSLDQRRRVLAHVRPHLVVLQQCRHPLNDPTILREGLTDRPHFALDVDDADWLDATQGPRLTRIASEVDLVVAGSRNVASWARTVNPATDVLWTTAAPPRRLPRRRPHDLPIVCWAPGNADLTHAERHLVARVTELAARSCRFELWIAGVTDDRRVRSDFRSVEAGGIPVRTLAPMAYRRLHRDLAQADIGLNPLCEAENSYASGKSFGKVLVYLGCDMAVVTTDTVDHPLFFEHGRNGYMCRTDEEWAAAITTLATDPATRREVTRAAHADYVARLTPQAAAKRFECIARAHFPTSNTSEDPRCESRS